MSAQHLITDHLDLWTGAVTHKRSAGRSSGKSGKVELNGIKKLRELILELAVRGKLVEQDPNDEPASVLLERIAEEKAQLVKEGKIKKPKALPEVSEEEEPFKLPNEWKWSRLPRIYHSISPSGRSIKSSEVSDEGAFPVVDQGKSHVTGYHDDENLVIKIPNPVVVFGDHTTARKYIDFDFIAGADGTKTLCPILIEPRYFYIHLLKYDLENRGYARHFKVLNEQLFAIPPIEEQHRIVAKVDELMALCDRLEQQAGDQLEAHEVLVDTLLGSLFKPAEGSLTRSADAAEVAENWARIAEHFDTLFTTEASIDKLKQTVLQLAVMGRLVEQDPNDEPAKEQLQWINSYLSETSDSILKKRKKLGPLSGSEIPFTPPKGWGWVRFISIALEYSVGLDKGKSQQAENKKYRYFKMNNILNDGGFQVNDIISVDATDEEASRYSLSSGDFLFNTRNSQELVGKTCVYIHDKGTPVLYNNNILRAKFDSTEKSRFIDIWMRSNEGKRKLENLKSGTTNVWAIYQGKLETLPCPLPPTEEQHRIVAKVDELMALCNQLKTRLSDAGETRVQLAEAVVEKGIH